MVRKNKERWRQVPGFPDYDVSDLGRIRTWKRGKPILMKTRIGGDGYPRVTLQDARGEKKVCRMHIIVARAFIGPAKGRLVRHRSKSKKANVSNLEYGTYMDNHRDKYRDGTDQRGEKNSQAELTRKQAVQIFRLKGEMTQKEISETFGISRQAVSDIHRGVTWARATGAKKK